MLQNLVCDTMAEVLAHVPLAPPYRLEFPPCRMRLVLMPSQNRLVVSDSPPSRKILFVANGSPVRQGCDPLHAEIHADVLIRHRCSFNREKRHASVKLVIPFVILQVGITHSVLGSKIRKLRVEDELNLGPLISVTSRQPKRFSRHSRIQPLIKANGRILHLERFLKFCLVLSCSPVVRQNQLIDFDAHLCW